MKNFTKVLILGLLLLGVTASAQSLGQIGSNIAGSLKFVGYAVYIVPVIVIAFAVYFFWRKGKNKKAKGDNIGIIYSINHRSISDIKSFAVVRVQDSLKNIENTKAVFADDIKKSQGGGGIVGFFKAMLGGAPKKDLTQEDGSVFNESLAVFNEQTRAWTACWTLETNLQIPLLTGKSEQETKLMEVKRNVDKRITSLKSMQLEGIKELDVATASSAFLKVIILCVVIIAVAIILLWYGEYQLSSTIAQTLKFFASTHPPT